jgi:bacterioferritin-associated ferredoxin
MYVCLCAGVTSHAVAAAVAAGASTSNEVARACGAGSECGRCRRSVRAIIDSRKSASDRVEGGD